ncbi:MAG: cytochrome ubiquinol oxidase subunit I [Pseudonocardia sp.]|uniref:cytochrome ubiquinol oxidase subunit I n=1 Tax=unclassified Pseudonocardia TaxID=2619320 RepID=UPI00086A6FD7|nr:MULTISPECIES: cytochrome ubiquinol oxidase subunit I [unclassified Pseudonocardia]MBN9110807.1 cytochrome ubiquinol oxidase subunit I [Pseudonocardia sp.]ODU26884.1 MAG: cytochrome BD ubiquinol oxidase subunit I [Pseudonocardia sp. SCN 72-51]ODV05393.1 MAG: cytochrome BD ubiquinol oxidase subunit I [Pseudonocardia sp. SCN 73-27]
MTVDLARWQFAITTVYHFLFVPLTIGMAFVVAGMQTAWVRTSDDRYLRMTKFWGKLFLINFAIGVVTGIVQEFQFGMNWSDYSRFVGDIFGAPLAIEGLLAFFLESTFLGLWIFGWDRLPKKVHLATIWLAAIGTMLSAYFILAANSWMQHPVGSVVNDAAGRAELKDFGAVLTNSTAVGAFAHTITACFLTAGLFVLAISAWHLRKGDHTEVFRPSIRIALVTTLVAALGVIVTGDMQARLMTEQQPMKMAAAEALYDTVAPASFSLFTVGTLDGSHEVWSIRVPRVLSFMATGSFDGRVDGINQLQAASERTYGPGDYTPNIPATYWTFRLMIGFGFLALLLSVVGLWLTRKRARRPLPRWYLTAGVVGLFLPFAANSAGWIFTEMGRQPWAVFGVLRTADGVSPGVGPASVWTSMIVFTLLYGALAVVELRLMARYVKAGPPPPAPVGPATAPEPTPSVSY